MHYRQTVDYDSNPYRELKRDMGRPHGLMFTLFFIYVPIFILTVALRAVMLFSDITIINLRVIDDLIVKYTYELSNFLTQFGYSLF